MDADPRVALRRRTFVMHKGRLARVGSRHLDPDQRPGIGRVSYDLAIALVLRDGTVTFPFHAVRAAASALEVLDERAVAEFIQRHSTNRNGERS